MTGATYFQTYFLFVFDSKLILFSLITLKFAEYLNVVFDKMNTKIYYLIYFYNIKYQKSFSKYLKHYNLIH